jgi:hypothetical protein
MRGRHQDTIRGAHRAVKGRYGALLDTLFNKRSTCVKTIRGAHRQKEAYEYGEATDKPRLLIERSKILERPSSMLARSLRSTRASPGKRIRRPLRPQ